MTANDERFLDTTMEDMELDYWTVYYVNEANNPDGYLEDEDYDVDAIVAQMALDNGDDDAEIAKIIAESTPDDYEDA